MGVSEFEKGFYDITEPVLQGNNLIEVSYSLALPMEFVYNLLFGFFVILSILLCLLKAQFLDVPLFKDILISLVLNFLDPSLHAGD